MDSERMTTAARSLEDAFLARENARLLAELRAEARKKERRQAMRDVISIEDEALVDHLLGWCTGGPCSAGLGFRLQS